MCHVCGFICYLCVELKLMINTKSLSNQALKSAHPSLLSSRCWPWVFIGAGQPLQHGEVRDTNLARVRPVVRAAPSGLRFWLTVDHRTNDSSSVCGVCEPCNISTRCKPLYLKCNRISSNISMNMMLSSPIHRRQRHFVDCQGTRMTQMTKDFVMRHDESYVE